MRRFVCILLVLFCVILCAGNGFAEVVDQNSDYQYVTDPQYKNDEDLINFRAKLIEMGFYKSAVDSNAANTLLLTDQDVAAMYEVCRLNPDIVCDPRIGVPCEVYWRVMGIVDRTLVTPNGIYYTIVPRRTSASLRKSSRATRRSWPSPSITRSMAAI